MGTLLTGLDAFNSETEPEPMPAPSTPAPGAGVLRVVDAYPRKDSYVRARGRQSRRPLTFRRLGTSFVRAARAVALFPFAVGAWMLLRIWWLIRLLVTGTWHAIISVPARPRESPPVVRVAIAGVPAWARDVPLVPAIAWALTLTGCLSVVLSLLLVRH